MSQSGGVGKAVQPLKTVLFDFIGQQSVGSVVWYIGKIVSSGQPPTAALRADIEIPDPRMTVRLDLRRNDDKFLLASHTIEIWFTLPPDFAHGEIANVPAIVVKAGETARGAALNGVPQTRLRILGLALRVTAD